MATSLPYRLYLNHTELDGDLRLLLKNGPNERGGVDGDRTDLVSEKLSDAALATHEAILKATNKGR
jgi:hypothetical protein